jgi:signal transduction histidine kinase
LAVTKRVVDEHGGRIALAEGEGPGATFTITLPADTGRVRDPSETATDKPDFSGV